MTVLPVAAARTVAHSHTNRALPELRALSEQALSPRLCRPSSRTGLRLRPGVNGSGNRSSPLTDRPRHTDPPVSHRDNVAHEVQR